MIWIPTKDNVSVLCHHDQIAEQNKGENMSFASQFLNFLSCQGGYGGTK